jgi:hypothetical protein
MNGERVERRLTAMVAADVVGYSRLMSADEEGTLARLEASRRELSRAVPVPVPDWDLGNLRSGPNSDVRPRAHRYGKSRRGGGLR